MQESKTAPILLIAMDGVLFEWNNKVDTLKDEGLVKVDIVLYPSITTEFPGVALTCHITIIEEN